MPEKHDLYQSYGEKLIGLFMRLLFSGERYSLTELSRILNCSKQTVLRLLDNIRKSYGITIEETKEGNKNYYRIKKPSTSLRNIPLTEAELQSLQLCKSFTQHLVGKKLYEEATRAIFKSKAALGQEGKISECNFSTMFPGTIDYTPHHQIIHTLIAAMEKRKVCKLTYHAIEANRPKTFHIKPLKLFSYHDAMYLHAQKAKEPGKPYKTPKYDPLLAVHRMKAVEMTNIIFQPEPFDFEKTFNQHFGVMKDEAFDVEVEFRGWAASFVAERRWSPNQEIVKKGKNKVTLKFTASSVPEVKSWLLSFGGNAAMISPRWLLNEIKQEMVKMAKCYIDV
ncbi:MAG TPA: WYL domain-containing protein [Smithellaceae bacterium]|jgi:predicted DNA-binding transcriptional regulator YafY|nr:WYL domain-containing protein [Saprospiraceae bacterium]HPD58288.1 WYL domain-containing protein [Smithellaceae bacterium]